MRFNVIVLQAVAGSQTALVGC